MLKRLPGLRALATVALVSTTVLFWWPPCRTTCFAASTSADQPATACGGDAALRNLFKGAPGGAKVKDKVELYDEKGLFNYIDGGAPLYVRHHFRRLGAAEMASDNGGELTCDIYDMNGPANAFSIFTAEKSSSFKPIAGWPEAASSPMAFVFHQGCYYVKLTAFDKKAESALPTLANALRERMKAAAPAPASK